MPKLVEICVVRISAVGRSKKSGGHEQINRRHFKRKGFASDTFQNLERGVIAPPPPVCLPAPLSPALACVLLESTYCFEKKRFEETSSKIEKLQLRKHALTGLSEPGGTGGHPPPLPILAD